MEYKVTIGNEDLTEYASIPANDKSTLDESLNIGFVKLNYTDKANTFKPLTEVVIEVSDDFGNTKKYYYFVAIDKLTEVISEKVYNHEIALIEQTKWLERFTGIVKTNTTPLINDISKAQEFCPIFKVKINGAEETTATSEVINIKSPYFNQNIEFDISSNINIPKPGNLDFKQVVLYFNGERVLFRDLTTTTIHISTPAKEGNWTVRFFAEDQAQSQENFFDFYCLPNYVEPETHYYTITKVINNLLTTAETINESETPRFALNEAQATEFANIKAPDFSLKGTLWECLSMIGDYLHSIPRLESGIIYFDKLGQNERVVDRLEDYCSSTETFNIEQYVSEIDSLVNNIVNTDNEQQGTISTPLKTPRTETGNVNITTENCFIETKEPIEKVVKLECGYLSNGQYVGDLTPYVFEKAEYDGLSQFDIGYPMSRNFAIYYGQGQRHIKGLSFKSPSAINPIFQDYAIINIIARKLNVAASSIRDEDIMNLQFKIEYIPVINARIKQSKVYVKDLTKTSMLEYNQSANKINSVAYGESMKGAVARLGNPEISKVFYFNDLSKLPKVGELYDESYYISIVQTEFYKDFVKCEIALSKDFNRLNEYVGINSQKRFYEISEKDAVKRPINYEDFCVVGDKEYINRTRTLFDTAVANVSFNQLFNRNEVNNDAVIDNAVIKLENGEKLMLPVNALAMGNSIIFNFRFDDNYSAGNTREVVNNANLQYQKRYTNYLGKLDLLQFALGKSRIEQNDYSQAVDSGNKLPIVKNEFPNSNILATNRTFFNNSVEDTQGIQILKDNREIISFTYQINLVAENDKYVIGSAFSQDCTFLNKTGKTGNVKLYILPYKLNKFQNEVDITGLTEVIYTASQSFSYFTEDFVANNSGKSFAFVDKNNKLIVGKNIDINVNDNISVYFTFTHKV